MIRRPRPDEIPLLPQIENAADGRFRHVGLRLVFDMPGHSLEVLRYGWRQGLLWVAASPTNRPVGFALLKITSGVAWIEQLSVLDRWQGRGFGTALIDQAQAAALARGHHTLHLTTYRDVSWNKPFYARRGFAELGRGELTHAMRVVLMTEVQHGHPVWRRAVMKR
jgi:GNAT superfamily N-acetyltransferase